MNENQGAVSGNTITLGDIVRLLLSKIYWLVFAGGAVGIAVYLGITLFVAPVYESHVSFYVYNRSDAASQAGTINNTDLQAAESLAETYSKILESNSVLDAVLQDLAENGELSRKELTRMISTSVISNTQLLEVVVSSTDAEFACEIANAFARVAPTEITRITKAGGVEVVDQPEVASEKSSPRTVFDTVVGAAVGIIICAAILIARTVSDTTIYLPEDIDKLDGVTVLGQIPEIKAPEGKYKHWKIKEKGGERLAGEKENKSCDGAGDRA